tara:strand:- start:3961 stop:4806 length:846 start_codon:yes stop_codon:yes gene_type:complete
MEKIVINSNAKVNIGLKVFKKKDNGYHDIVTVFQEIDLSDTITLTKNPHACHFNSNVDWLRNDNDNLCILAYKLMKKNYGIGGINIDLNKKIPPGSGLGGGSSNAASIMKGVCKLFSLNIPKNELERLAVNIGADVPFFINGSIQLGEGIGEKLTPLKKKISGKYLIIIPDIIIDTFWAYSQFKNGLDTSSSSINLAGLLNKKTTSFNKFKLIENDFESIVIPTYPEIGEIKEQLCAFGAQYASLSGSGSTVFGIFNDEALLEKAFSYFTPKYNTFISCPI